MASVTDLLRECHRLRKHIKALQEEIDRGPRVLKAQQNRLAGEEQAHQAHHDNIKKLKLKQRDDEGTLKETETRLIKLAEQLNSAGNSKEFDAKTSEIRQANEKKSLLEDAILTTIAEIEDRTGEIPAVEAKWAEAQAEFAAWKQEAAERLERLKTDLVTSNADLAKYDQQLPDKVKSYYDAQVRGHGPNALAGVKNRVCQGCQTSLTEQLMMNLRSGQFHACSGCGKLLYPVE